MFAVIYRAFIKPGLELDYQEARRQVASYFVKSRGAIGSCLYKTNESMWVAYSCWPDKATRDASYTSENAPADALPDEIKKAIVTIQKYIDQTQKLPDTCMEVVDDLLHTNQFEQA